MHRPGDRGGEEGAQHGFVGERLEQRPDAWGMFCRGQGVEKNVKSKQHQPQPDGHAAEVANPSGRD